MDYVRVSKSDRDIAVCITCEHVFYDDEGLRGPFNTEYLKLVSMLRKLLSNDPEPAVYGP